KVCCGTSPPAGGPTARSRRSTCSSRRPAETPTDSETSPTTDCDYSSPTAASGTITPSHGSEPAIHASWRRAGKVSPPLACLTLPPSVTLHNSNRENLYASSHGFEIT